MKPFYITTAISYPNGPPHIGHAYEAIATDVLARFWRLKGYDVFFLTGTDDHGQKMVQTASKQGKTPEQLADEMVPAFRKMVKDCLCSNDDFIRTSEKRHHDAVIEMWRRMEEKGDIYLDHYAGWYCVRDEAFYTDSDLTTNELGEKIGPNGNPVEWMEEESYFFRLSAYQDRLLEHYKKHPEFLQPKSRMNEIVNFVKGGLKDLSISRTNFDWGVKVPNNDKHIVYVWVDALTNYISSLGFPNDKKQYFNKYWPANLHIIGKDITRFHAVYWPAFLFSAELALPKTIFAHGFLNLKGKKMSKSSGNVLSPDDMLEHFGVDQTRYFLMREVIFGADGSFSDEAITQRINADLANDLGNLAQRCLSMIMKNCEGLIPKPAKFSAQDKEMLEMADNLLEKVSTHMEQLAPHHYLAEIWELIAEANRYFAMQKPWELKESDIDRMNTTLYVTAELIRQIAILVQPVVPKGAEKLLNTLNIEKNSRDFVYLGKKGRLAGGIALADIPEGVFPRLQLKG